jgi:hypothetical protein
MGTSREGIDERVANVAERYALRRGHDDPCQSTVYHASRRTQGRADSSRTSRAHAEAEPRTRHAARHKQAAGSRHAGAPRPREPKPRRVGAALRRGHTEGGPHHCRDRGPRGVTTAAPAEL